MWHYCVPLVSFSGYLLSGKGYKSRVFESGWINDCVCFEILSASEDSLGVGCIE